MGLSESHRDGPHRPASADEIKRFKLPENSVIIADLSALQLKVSCSEKTAERICNGIDSAKKCMNVADDEPIYYGR